MNFYSTGEVSKKLTISLRTLRYYDEIGLVVPSKKEDNGKRLYNDEDIFLLEKIILLKSASISLNDIKQIINHITIFETLTIHKEQLEDHIQQLQQSINYTNTLLNILKLEEELQWKELIPLFAEEQPALKKKDKIIKSIFNKEEQKILKEKLPKLENDPRELTKWIHLIKRIERCLEEQRAPHSKDAQMIAEEILLLSAETFNGEKELEAKFWEVRKSEKASSNLNLYPIRKEIIDFLEEAILIYEKEKL
ncbi:MerR family transcriptional regulator [Niallia sp. FSL W8-0635]|uniref:MerR family transcriptional regulator n=1 Tax=Niallia sp. FSL W8-0635 TaxID=2975337 RepID=UPI0009CF1C0F|nr:putative transcriptional regulator [Mycobacteroides abscessus subsp. abscessus]HEO8421988.1 MerR family transcriptional regulator [Yersinia enterocolitica]